MILFTILVAILLILIITIIAFASVGGAAAIIMCSDLIACAGLIGLFIWLLIRKKRR